MSPQLLAPLAHLELGNSASLTRGWNGPEVVQAARKIRTDLPIILPTGYADTGAIESLADPTLVVLRKPFQLDELVAAFNGKLTTEAS